MASIQAPAKLTKRSTASSRLADALRDKVATGEYNCGMILPNRRLLSAQYSVAPSTVDQAIKHLVAEGVLRTEARRGTFVEGRPAGIEIPEAVPQSMFRPEKHAGYAVRTETIGFLCDSRAPRNSSEAGHYDAARTLRAFEAAASASGASTCQINIYRPDNSLLAVDEIVEALAKTRVAAAVVHLNTFWDVEWFLSTRELRNAAAVLVGGTYDERIASQVYFDDIEAARCAALHLISRGRRRLAFFSPFEAEWVSRRFEAAKRAASLEGPEYSLSPFIGPVVESSQLAAMPEDLKLVHAELGRKYARAILDRLTVYDGIIATNDLVAYGLLDELQSHGIEPGRDLAVIGFDDAPSSSVRGLSTMRPPYEDMGAQAAWLALRILSDGAHAHICLQSKVIARTSTTCELQD